MLTHEPKQHHPKQLNPTKGHPLRLYNSKNIRNWINGEFHTPYDSHPSKNHTKIK